ncbi:Hypothetical protein POVN_LOCUS379 [uncultured virus]|nr:Hypothetical protein POVN_LOCUS379 [uncultured virus]
MSETKAPLEVKRIEEITEAEVAVVTKEDGNLPAFAAQLSDGFLFHGVRDGKVEQFLHGMPVRLDYRTEDKTAQLTALACCGFGITKVEDIGAFAEQVLQYGATRTPPITRGYYAIESKDDDTVSATVWEWPVNIAAAAGKEGVGVKVLAEHAEWSAEQMEEYYGVKQTHTVRPTELKDFDALYKRTLTFSKPTEEEWMRDIDHLRWYTVEYDKKDDPRVALVAFVSASERSVFIHYMEEATDIATPALVEAFKSLLAYLGKDGYVLAAGCVMGPMLGIVERMPLITTFLPPYKLYGFDLVRPLKRHEYNLPVS